MNKRNRTSLLALLLAFAMMLSLAACGKKPEESEDSVSEPEVSTGYIFINPLPESTGNEGRFPSFLEQIDEKFGQNADTVGWLQLPGTHLDDVVVCYTDPKDDNNFYYRRNFEKEYSFNGIFYADFRCQFGNGDAADLSNNTVIYGHTMDENPDGVMFAPTLKFLDEDFAKKTPYIYFSTANEDLVWEVFSVFFATIDLPYNCPDLSAAEFENVLGECLKRSIYTYDTQVSATDKILTLSTCTYSLPNKGKVAYPNDYRYVIMAKLVDKATADKTEATFTVNPSPKDP